MGENILVICSSTPSNVAGAIRRLPQDTLFPQAQIDLLSPAADLPSYHGWRAIRQVLVFPKRRDWKGACRLWWRLRRQRYAVVVVLWCLERGRNRQKAFALLAPARRILVFNENLDCAYLRPRFLKLFLQSRIRDGHFGGCALLREALKPIQQGFRGLARLVLFPVRFFLLLCAVAGVYLTEDRGKTNEKSGSKREL